MRPDVAFEALLSRAMADRAAGRFDDAEASCRGVLSGHAEQPDALHLLGVLSLQRGKHDDAIDLLRRAARARPDSAEVMNNLGLALEARNQLDTARNAYLAALRMQPAYVSALVNLGNVLRKQQRPADALDAYRAAVRLKPGDSAAWHGLALAAGEQGLIEQNVEGHRRLCKLRPESAALHSDLLQVLQHDPRETPQSLFEEARRFAARHEAPHGGKRQPHGNAPDPDRRLRVGYVSPDFRDHPIGRLAHPVIANHDRSAFEVFCYSDAKSRVHVTDAVKSVADHWHDVHGVSDDDLAEQIRRDEIDLLIECAGHFGGNRLTMFARKPAPVQVSHFGYCATSGLSSIDYRITDSNSDPPGTTERFHTEKLFRVDPCCWVFRPPDGLAEVGPPPVTMAGHVTFGCLSRPLKVNDDVAAVWSRILLAVPGSRLILLSVAADNPRLVERFTRHGVAPDRIELAGRRSRIKYLELHNRIDVALDPWPFNGDNTICDAFLMGVPSVALAGDAFVSRRGVSHLRAVGLDDLVADDRDAYVRVAVKLAGDVPRLAHLRETLRDRLHQSPLRDPAGYTRRLEQAYRRMWRAWCAGRAGA